MGVEGFDSSDCGYCSIHEGGSCSGLLPVNDEKGPSEYLGNHLNGRQQRYGEENDEGEGPGPLESQDKAGYTGCQILNKHP